MATMVSRRYAFKARQLEDLKQKQDLLQYLSSEASRSGGETKLRHALEDFMVGHPQFGLSLRKIDEEVFFEKALSPVAKSRRSLSFEVVSPLPGHLPLSVELSLDIGNDAALLRRIGTSLVVAAVGGTLLISFGGFLLVWLGLRPLRELSSQVKSLTADTLHRRLDGSNQPEELAPLIAQFNDLLSRLDKSYEQLEGFNADVAHELLTPLSTLMSGSELALQSPQGVDDLRDMLGSNLEELQRLAGIVNDMLFLSQADRGAKARRQATKSLAAIARQVVNYHEAALEDAGVAWEIEGDAEGEFDTPLLQRALSNLIGNATRYATPGSTVRLRITPSGTDDVIVRVENHGDAVDPNTVSRMFDRFFRDDPSRSGASKNHGLGLSIVAAIARMHGGLPLASSSGGITSVGIQVKRAG